MRRIRHQIGIALAVTGLAVMLLGFGAGTQRAQVPWVLGRSEAQAVKRIERRDLRAEILERSAGARKLHDRFRAPGQVVFQNYRGGMTLPRGTTVKLMLYPGGERG